MKQPLTTSTKKLKIEGQIIKQPQTIKAKNDKLLTRGGNKNNPKQQKQEIKRCQLRAKL